MVDTASDVFRNASTTSASRGVETALVVMMSCDDPSLPPSRHRLAGVDVVCFARGPRDARRDRVDGMSRLVITIPDPVMSSDHGQLLCVQSRWILDDPRSKNGAIIAGSHSRSGLVNPGDLFELGHTLFLLESIALPEHTPSDLVLDVGSDLVSLHPPLREVDAALDRFARNTLPIVLLGDTGTGKEVYAQAIHARSARSGAFIAVNCGALTDSLLEAELFGHRRGAFSGATADRPGFVRAADRGTLFLDEITELSGQGQVALLRVLQQREVVPVGDSLPLPVDVRVCAAAQRSLAVEVDAGRFRGDLYARLLGYEVRLPPLRERACDLGALIGRLLARLAPGRRITLAPGAARALVSYDWPRNVRELERALASALVLADAGVIHLRDLPEPVRRASSGRVRGGVGGSPSTDAPIEAPASPDGALRAQLAAKLVEHRGNISAIARDLGKHREQIKRWLRRFGFDPGAFRG